MGENGRMPTVLVPLDGSDAAERAVDVAQALALHLFADLVLVRSAWDTPESEVTAYLDGVLDRHDLDLDTTGKVIYRFPADAMHDLATEYEDAVLCLFSHGRSGLGHAVLGSQGEAILARSVVPVFVVGPQTKASFADGRHVGLCVDAATDETAFVPFAVQWAARLRLDADVLTVRAEDDRPISRFHPASRERLDEAVALLEAGGVHARSFVLSELQPARCLARYADDHDLALLIAAKRSGTGVARDFLGSTAMNLVHHSPCPVLFPPALGGELPATGPEHASPDRARD
jgi:nucleotide-binding universal stress UspA family protein